MADAITGSRDSNEGSSTDGERGPGRPNVVMVVADQLRADHTGFGGNPVVRTPNLDSIACEGTRFDRAFVSNPICMPNRSTILTGRMPSVHGVRFNGIPLDWGANTFVRELRRHGYRTGLVGKAHFQNMGHLPGVSAALLAGEGDAVANSWPPGWDQWENIERHQAGYVRMPQDWYGFDHVDLVVDHSDRCSGHYYQWLIDQGVNPSEVLGPANRLSSVDLGWDQIYEPALSEELYPTTYVGLRSTEFIERAAKSAEPFFLQVSFPDPHHPFTPPGRYYKMYDPADVPMPTALDDPHERSMNHLKTMVALRGNPPVVPVLPFACTEELYREASAKEYGMITMIDDAVGEVLATLDRLSLAENTVVVLTSDHGEMFGDHGLMLKGSMHYQGCVRVPLVISPAGVRSSSDRSGCAERESGASPTAGTGQACGSLVSSIDLPETILSLCGVKPYYGMQGFDLTPLLDDPSASVRDRVLIEEDEMFDVLGTGRPLRMRTVVTGAGRLTRYEGTPQGEIFDLAEDPDEMVNVFDDPARTNLRDELTEALLSEMVRLADDSPKPTHLA